MEIVGQTPWKSKKKKTPKLIGTRKKIPARKPKRIPQELVRTAILKTFGNLTQAARILGCDRSNLAHRIKNTPALQEALDEGKMRLLDLAESANLRLLLEGDNKAIDRVLRSFGKDFGWVYPTNKKNIKKPPDSNGSVINTIQDLFRIQKEMEDRAQQKRG